MLIATPALALAPDFYAWDATCSTATFMQSLNRGGGVAEHSCIVYGVLCWEFCQRLPRKTQTPHICVASHARAAERSD